jgi:hypothetical protein
MKDPTFSPGRQECSDEGLTRILHHVDPAKGIDGVALLPFAVGFRRSLKSGSGDCVPTTINRTDTGVTNNTNNNSTSYNGGDAVTTITIASDNLLIVPYKHDYDAKTPDEFFSGIRTHETEILSDCSRCKKQHKQILRGSIERLNDIILVRFNKITAAGGSKKVIWYPYEFSSPYVGNKKITFRLVATIEHSGSDGGGHYYARVLRGVFTGGIDRGRQWYLCNDSSVTPIPNADPTADTFIVAYHSITIS